MKNMSKLAVEIRGYIIEQVIENGDNTVEGVKEMLSNPETLAQVNSLCQIVAMMEEGKLQPKTMRKEFFLNKIAELSA